MKEDILIAGVNGTGKSNFRGVLVAQGVTLGHIVDPNAIANQNGFVKVAEISDGAFRFANGYRLDRTAEYHNRDI